MSSSKPITAVKSLLGAVDYDTDSSNLVSNLCSISVPCEADLKRGAFVKIGKGPAYFIGQIIDGPYYAEAKKGLTIASRYIVELSGYIENGDSKAVLTRPVPGTPVEPIDTEDVRSFLGISGGMYMGCILTNRDVSVMMDPATLSRHIGVFGTTGSGKSNTIQVLMEEACNQGLCVLVFDVEGEYIEMDKPTDRLIDILSTFDRRPKGVEDVKVYVPFPSFCHRQDAIRFGIKFCDADTDVFAEVTGLNRMEQLYFEDLIEKVQAVTPDTEPITLAAIIERLAIRLKGQTDRPTMPPFIAEAHTTLYGKLCLTRNQNIVDADAPSVKMEDVFKAGRATVVDFSDATDYVRNIVIAELLHKAFKYKIMNPETPQLFIVIEEAHAFISKEKRDRMLATLMLIIETARRGRKRGLCLGVVTQQPAHIPSEILELCNTRIMHRMSSIPNINVLKESTGTVPEGMWNTVPSLGRGESVIATHKYSRALSVLMRPTASKRIATD